MNSAVGGRQRYLSRVRLFSPENVHQEFAGERAPCTTGTIAFATCVISDAFVERTHDTCPLLRVLLPAVAKHGESQPIDEVVLLFCPRTRNTSIVPRFCPYEEIDATGIVNIVNRDDV